MQAYRDADAAHKLQLEALELLPEALRAPLLEAQRSLLALMEAAVLEEVPDLPRARRRPVVMSIFGMLNWHYMWHKPGRGLSRAGYGDLVADLLSGGLGKV